MKLNRTLTAIVLAVLAVPCDAQNKSSQKGVITGSVLTEDGQPVAGAWVTVETLRSPEQVRVQAFGGRALTGRQGSYTLRDVPPGRYRLCADAPGSDLLNPCEWNTYAQVLSISPGQIAMQRLVHMRKGHRLSIRVEDPGGHLNTHLNKTNGANLTILGSGPWRPGKPARVLQSDKSGMDLEAVVAFDVPYTVTGMSTFFQLGKDTGQAFASNGGQLKGLTKKSDVDQGKPPKVVIRVQGLKK